MHKFLLYFLRTFLKLRTLTVSHWLRFFESPKTEDSNLVNEVHPIDRSDKICSISQVTIGCRSTKVMALSWIRKAQTTIISKLGRFYRSRWIYGRFKWRKYLFHSLTCSLSLDIFNLQSNPYFRPCSKPNQYILLF